MVSVIAQVVSNASGLLEGDAVSVSENGLTVGSCVDGWFVGDLVGEDRVGVRLGADLDGDLVG
jgi:hypothetical protein